MSAKDPLSCVAADELSSIQRNLQFHPSTVNDLKALTPEQVEAYNRDGYIKGIPVFGAAAMDQYRRQFDAILARVMAAGGDSYSISFRSSEIRDGVRPDEASEHPPLREGHLGREHHRVGVPFLLQDAWVLNQTVENPERFGELIHDELKAGEMSMHNDLLLHGSEPNTSNRRRCGLTLRYCATEVRAHMGCVLVSGEDPSGHWQNPPRPETQA
ncbi:MAG: hypothetical protein ABIP55_02155 [Tepidisphaeraceae bacterium]